MIKIFEIIVGILLYSSFIYFMKNVTKLEFRYKKLLTLYIIVYCVIYGFLVYFLQPEITTFITFISIIMTYKIFTKISNKDLLFYTIVQWLIGIILDIIVMIFVNVVFKTNFRIVGSFLMTIAYFLIGSSSKAVDFINKIKKKLYDINYFSYILIAFIIIYFYLGSFCLKYMDNQLVPIMIFFISTTFLVLIVSFIIQISQIKSLKESIKILTRNNEFYIERLDDYRILKHNLIANLNGIKAVTNKKTINLIDDLILKYKGKLNLPKNFKQLPTGINGIIYEKIYNVIDTKLNISINNKIKNNIIEVLTARNYNLFCEALSIALDNAIEASEKSKEKILFLEILEDKEKLILKIINSFDGVIDIDKLGTKNYTSKRKGNGLGLFSILNLKTVTITTSIKNNKYFCTIEVKKINTN